MSSTADLRESRGVVAGRGGAAGGRWHHWSASGSVQRGKGCGVRAGQCVPKAGQDARTKKDELRHWLKLSRDQFPWPERK